MTVLPIKLAPHPMRDASVVMVTQDITVPCRALAVSHAVGLHQRDNTEPAITPKVYVCFVIWEIPCVQDKHCWKYTSDWLLQINWQSSLWVCIMNLYLVRWLFNTYPSRQVTSFFETRKCQELDFPFLYKGIVFSFNKHAILIHLLCLDVLAKVISYKSAQTS